MFGAPLSQPVLKPMGLNIRAPTIGVPMNGMFLGSRPSISLGQPPMLAQPQPVFSQAPVRPIGTQPTIRPVGLISVAQPPQQGSSVQNNTVGMQPLRTPGPRIEAQSLTEQTPIQTLDPQLIKVKELRLSCGLKRIPVGLALATFKSAAQEGNLAKNKFLASYQKLLSDVGVEVPDTSTQEKLFELFDRDHNGVVDMMELVCGISLFCQGSEEDKIKAVFSVFDENGDGFISMDEMFKFLASVFKVMLTPTVVATMKRMGFEVDSAEDLASITALECFKVADLNQDSKLSIQEFNVWFYAPKNDPTFLFAPMRQLVE